MKKFDIAILGAGASGCMCAINCLYNRKSVVLIDKVSQAGKKLLATGNGRCNITHIGLSNKHAYNQNLDQYFNRFDDGQTICLFRDLGLELCDDGEKRVYPRTNSAKSVIDVFYNNFAKNKNLLLQLETEIINVEKQDDVFKVTTNKGEFMCQKLVVALGGNKGQEILDKFEIPYQKFIPSLCALKTEKTKLLENTRVSNVKVTATTKSGRSYKESGEILFKDSGISGICIFNLSAMFAREGKFEGSIAIDLMPDYDEKFLKILLHERKKIDVKLSKFFEGLFVNPLAYHLLNTLKLNEEKSSKNLTDAEIDKMAKLIKNLTFTVKGNYDNNQVYTGGVHLSCLDENLQSKQVPNLYFCGEICDVDGICGGYNLQWAWTSGHIVGLALNN
ncbi:MAG: aminoacetone oxidase family FAD-binding enzyme [Clostridia bacterium]|nr:aminoacetone oxidase family FAD-binding enzyme [Clostridia bacterium]